MGWFVKMSRRKQMDRQIVIGYQSAESHASVIISMARSTCS